jgi:hypothetical protein
MSCGLIGRNCQEKRGTRSAFIFQLFGVCCISFGGPSKCFKGNAFALPCMDNVGIDLSSFVESREGFVVLTLIIESIALFYLVGARLGSSAL